MKTNDMTNDDEHYVSSDEEEVEEEGAPLLEPDHNEGHKPLIPQSHSPRIVVFLITIIIFIAMVGSFLAIVPFTRVYEDIICHHYYDALEGEGHIALLSGKIDESLCKVDAIQEELAIVFGGEQLFGAIFGLFFSFPYGLLADRIGRKPVFALSFVGVLLMMFSQIIICRFWTVLPLRLVWLSPLFTIVGGGQTVIQSMLYALLSDVSTEETRANNFFLLMVGSLGGELIAPSLASYLMQRDPWIPIWLGTILIMLGASLMVFVPETLHLHPNHGAMTPNLEDEDEDSPGFANGMKPDKTFLSALKSYPAIQVRRLYAATSVLHSVPVLLLLISFLVFPLTRTAIDLSVRYISVRFSWTLSQAGFLLSLRAGVNIILFLAIMPAISHILTRPTPVTSRLPKFLSYSPNLTDRSKDLLLARASILFLFVGSLAIGAAPTVPLAIIGLVIYTLGMGFTALCRSVLTTLVDQQHVARLYSAIGVIEMAGSMAAGPGLAFLFNIGLKKKGDWIGLPWFGLALLCLVAGVGVFAVRLPRKAREANGGSYAEPIVTEDTIPIGRYDAL